MNPASVPKTRKQNVMVLGLLLSRERTCKRKIRETILAYRLERNHSKEEILYLVPQPDLLGTRQRHRTVRGQLEGQRLSGAVFERCVETCVPFAFGTRVTALRAPGPKSTVIQNSPRAFSASYFSEKCLASQRNLCNKMNPAESFSGKDLKGGEKMGKRLFFWSMGAFLALTVTFAGCKKKEEPPPPPPPAPAAPAESPATPAPEGSEPAPAAPVEEKKMEEKKG